MKNEATSLTCNSICLVHLPFGGCQNRLLALLSLVPSIGQTSLAASPGWCTSSFSVCECWCYATHRNLCLAGGWAWASCAQHPGCSVVLGEWWQAGLQTGSARQFGRLSAQRRWSGRSAGHPVALPPLALQSGPQWCCWSCRRSSAGPHWEWSPVTAAGDEDLARGRRSLPVRNFPTEAYWWRPAGFAVVSSTSQRGQRTSSPDA